MILTAALLLAVASVGAAAAPQPPAAPPPTKQARQKPPPAAGNGSQIVYTVVLDAGSTGSRVHVYRFQQNRATAALQLLGEVPMALRPGLSSYGPNATAAANSLVPLLKAAVKAVPEGARTSTKIRLRATAGLRLLPTVQADNILKAVASLLAKYPFKTGPDAVAILDGAHEGSYAWLTLNFLLSKLGSGKGLLDTVATIDLGGGSMQEAFALPPAQAKAAPPGYTTSVNFETKTYDVYVHSYLGYGLMAARAALIASGKNGTDRRHGCFAQGVRINYTYAGASYALEEVVESGNFEGCANAAVKALHTDKCDHGKAACSFDGAWHAKPEGMQTVYYISSYFWDRAIDSGIIHDPDANSWPTTPGAFKRRAVAVCGRPIAEIQKKYGIQELRATFFCSDLTFLYTVLAQGLKLRDDESITLVKKIVFNGEAIEASWPLGMAIDELSPGAPNATVAKAALDAKATPKAAPAAKAAPPKATPAAKAAPPNALPAAKAVFQAVALSTTPRRALRLLPAKLSAGSP